MKHPIYCLLAALCLAGKGTAQDVAPPVKPLTVGDTLPDMVINNLYNYPADQLRLSDLKDKKVLLDFWSTWCGSCIESFPHLHALQAEHRQDLQVLMINSYASNSKATVDRLFQARKQRTGQDFILPYVLQDSILATFFPHETLPHYVWLNPGGRVVAITGPEAVTDTNIRNWLAGATLALPLKNDALLFDEHKEQLDSAGSIGMVYRSLLTRSKEGLGSVIGSNSTPDELLTRYYIINYGLLQLYQLAFPEVFNVPFNRIMVDEVLAGMAKALFCYDLVTKPISRQQAITALRTDLWRSFNITACNEQRVLDCYVLSAGKNIQQSISKGGQPAEDTDSLSLRKYIRNRPMSSLLSFLGSRFQLPWVDETGLRQRVDIDFPANFFSYNLEEATAFLRGYGLVLTRAKRRLRVAVLKPGPGAPFNHFYHPSTH